MKPETNDNTSLVIREPQELEAPPVASKPRTPLPTAKEMRVVEISSALAPAYGRAGTLELSEEEGQRLMEAFPNSMVEKRPHDGLFYIPHIHVSDRLTRVFGPGKWTMLRRWENIENNTIYAEWVMIIRGVYIGESVGAAQYHPNNPKQNYSDALESTRGEALRRIAAKYLACGSQVWDPSYCRGLNNSSGSPQRQRLPEAADAPPQRTAAAPQQTRQEPVASQGGSNWRDVELHFGKNKGKKLGELDVKQLNWYRNDWQPSEWPEGSGKYSDKDLALRRALNESEKESAAKVSKSTQEAREAVEAQDEIPMA